jgi:hypothetical protein
MATRNLARTVIEGERCQANRSDRRASNGVQRTNARRASGALASGADADFAVYPVRKIVWPYFYYELEPAKRWRAGILGKVKRP